MRVLTEMDSAINRIDSDGIVEPFDVRSELAAHAAKMASMIPCLLERPYEAIPLSSPAKAADS